MVSFEGKALEEQTTAGTGDRVEATMADICAITHFRPGTAVALRTALNGSLSLNAPTLAYDGRTIGEAVASDEPHPVEILISQEANEEVRSVLDVLSARSRHIIEGRFGFRGNVQTLEQLGRRFNVTCERKLRRTLTQRQKNEAALAA